ncbi:DMT family transporter [Hymenobacter ginsengisoli]|uniref:DMT family transporter n=1 Tax=Hymenobacter ginsengisoli TaxID=1051626 RepID=A0ABP8Q9R1_9BACT|nr:MULTISPECIES: DMT family transporter [unclassified Hymenobacter]MBO2031552.1 DMT family transporter [Hymenobacter sp. BT559]
MRLSPGILYMLASTALLAVVNVAVKKLDGLPTAEIIFARCFISLTLTVIQLRRTHEPVWGPPGARGNLWGRGIFGAGSIIGGFLALKALPIGGAVTLTYLAPVVTAVAAIWLVGEPLKPWQWLFYALAVAGVVLAKGTDGLLSAGVLIGVGAAVSSGMSSVFLRRVGNKIAPLVPVFYFNLVPLAIAAGWMLFDLKLPRGTDWAWLALAGIFTHVALWCVTQAFQEKQANFVAALDYLGLIYATAMGYFVFGDKIKPTVYPGIGLVLLGVLLNAWYLSRQEKKPA